MLLGGIFQATGNNSPATVPLKGKHSLIDLERWARYFQVPFSPNPHFPLNTLQLMRGAVAMQMRSDEEFHRYLSAIFSAMFENPRNLNDLQELAAVLVCILSIWLSPELHDGSAYVAAELYAKRSRQSGWAPGE